MKRWYATIPAALLLAAGCSTGHDAVQDSQFTFTAPGGRTEIHYPADERQKLAPLSGESLMQQGKTLSVSDFAGKPVLLNIWGSWCPPCRVEAPEIQRIADEGKVAVLGLDVKDYDRSAAQDFVTDNRFNYPSIWDDSGRSLLALNGYPRNAVPSTIVLDREHRVAAVYLTPVTADELRPTLDAVAGRAG